MRGEDPVRVVVADDSILLREGLVRLLEEAGLEVVGQAADGEELLRKVRAHKPDVAVVDVRMPPTHTDEGLRAAREIRAELPEVARPRPLPVRRGRLRAASCWPRAPRGSATCSRTGSPTSTALTDAVRRVGGGGSALDPEVVSQMLGRAPRRRPARGADPARARGPRADGRGPLQRGDRRRAGRHRARGREARHQDLRQARAAAPAARTTAACWRCCASSTSRD